MRLLKYQISLKSDRNCGRDSATVFSFKMAAVTSSIMLMSQIMNNQTPHLKGIVCEKFYFFCFKRFVLWAILKCCYLRVFWVLIVFITDIFGQMHYIFICSSSAGQSQSYWTFCFQIHVTSIFNGFSNRHFDKKLMT